MVHTRQRFLEYLKKTKLLMMMMTRFVCRLTPESSID